MNLVIVWHHDFFFEISWTPPQSLHNLVATAEVPIMVQVLRVGREWITQAWQQVRSWHWRGGEKQREEWREDRKVQGRQKVDMSKNKVTSVKEKKDEGHLELISNNYVVDNETVMMMEGCGSHVNYI